MPAYRPIEERFWEKVDINGLDECWNWLGGINNYKYKSGTKQYGRIKMPRERRTEFAHRLSYILHYGDIPQGKIVCHKCGNPLCVNPRHLYAGTHTDNNIDRLNHGNQSGGARTGRAHHMCKYAEEELEEILCLLKQGESVKQIVSRLGISKHLVYCLRSGSHWYVRET